MQLSFGSNLMVGFETRILQKFGWPNEHDNIQLLCRIKSSVVEGREGRQRLTVTFSMQVKGSGDACDVFKAAPSDWSCKLSGAKLVVRTAGVDTS